MTRDKEYPDEPEDGYDMETADMGSDADAIADLLSEHDRLVARVSKWETG